jgi:FkbM family methyltransferase
MLRKLFRRTKESTFPGLNDRLLAKLRRFAEVRSMTPETAFRVVARAGADLIPKTLHPHHCPSELDVAEAWLVDSVTVRLKQPSGRVFYGYPSTPREAGLYYLFRDCVSPALDAVTYGLAMEIVRRYLPLRPREGYPGPGGVMVDVGAYTGLKAMHYADVVGPEGRVVAIEVDRHNYDLLCRNVEANRLPVTAVHAGVWNARGTARCRGREKQRVTLVPADDLGPERGYVAEREVPTDTLDHILDEQGIDEVDYLNVQVNGAEMQVLEGFTLERAKVVWVASYYRVEGKRLTGKVREHLLAHGFGIVEETPQGGILARRRD